jgi:hypothetical protein
MAQLERKIGIASQVDGIRGEGVAGVDAVAAQGSLELRDYEMASLDDSDFDSVRSGELRSTALQHTPTRKASVTFLLWFLLLIHLTGLVVWYRVWMRDRKVKAARTGKMTPPPQRQSCTYDVDNRFISKLELPLKALKLAKS